MFLSTGLTLGFSFPGTSRSLVALWKDSSLGLGILAMVLLTVGDAYVPWSFRFSPHLRCSGSWTQVWDKSWKRLGT